MNYNEWLDQNREDVLDALPKYTYYDFKISKVLMQESGILKEKANAIFDAINTDGEIEPSEIKIYVHIYDPYRICLNSEIIMSVSYDIVDRRYMAPVDITGNKTISLNNKIVISVTKNDNPDPTIDEFGRKKIALIDKFAVVTPHEYNVSIPNKKPISLADSISALTYYLNKGDVSSAYQLIGNISAETKNALAENKFNSVKYNTSISIKVKPCQL